MEKAVTSAVDVLKLTLTLATGALVFSAELLKEDITITHPAKYCLILSWVLLGISIVTGALSFTRVPVMIASGQQSLNDKWFKYPGQVHHIAFLFGVAFLGVAMVIILWAKSG